MNKLVSRNPVLRFKLGRKIEKFLNPSRGINSLEKYVGGGTKIINGIKDLFKGWNINSGIIPLYKKNISTSQTPTQKISTDYSWMKGGTRLRTPEELKKWEAEVLRLKNLQNNINTKLISKNNPPSIKVTQKKNWKDEFKNNFTNTLTNAQRQYLDSKGINYTDAAAVLEFLMNLLKTDLGGYKNDGKWGKNSILAWKDFVANNIPENFDVQRNQETMTIGNKPYVEQPTTPVSTLGYRTYNTYEGNDFSNRLKSMGIKSNADLIDFMYKTNGENYNWNGDSWARLFRSDVNLALGGDYSDANIRKIFNTSGNWGKGFLGRGDIGDFQNALQINAGIWNGIYDNKLQNWIKNFDWSKFKYFKQGGNLLPSRNIIERFKLRKFK